MLDEDDTVGVRGASSRGICYAQKSLEIFDRLGIYERIRAQGHHLVGRPHLLGRRRGLFVQPRRTTAALRAAALHQPAAVLPRVVPGRAHPRARPRRDLRWKNRVTAFEHGSDGAVVEVETPAGATRSRPSGSIDATGANSRIRDELGLEAHPSRRTDRWCISRRPLQDAVRRSSAGPGSTRRSTRAAPSGSTSWPTTSGASTTRWTSTADPEAISRPEDRRRAPARAARPRRRVRVRLDRPVPVPRPPARRPFASAARSSSATRPTSSARSARAAATTASRTPPTSAGSSPSCSQGRPATALLDSYHARAPRGGGREPARHEPHRALPRAAQRRRAPPAPRRRRPGAHARVRAPPRQHRPDGAGQRLSAVAVGARRRALAAEHRHRRHDGDAACSATARASSASGSARAANKPRRSTPSSAARWPLDVHARRRAGALARHLGARPGSFVLVRPDAYVAAQTRGGGAGGDRSGAAPRAGARGGRA